MMKKIAIFCVTYNSYPELDTYLKSIQISNNFSENLYNIDIFISDNNPTQEILTANYPNLNIKIYKNNNLGYLGGAFFMLNQVELSEYQYIIISNIDLKLKEDFFEKLNSIKIEDNIGWIAPRIFNPKKEYNPFLYYRISRLKLNLICYINKYKILYQCNNLKNYIRNNTNVNNQIQKIYAGHGSIMIFTKKFLSSENNWTYPSFMYGEEIFMAEKVLEKKLLTVYYPNVCVENTASASIKLIDDKQVRQWQYDATKNLLNLFKFKN